MFASTPIFHAATALVCLAGPLQAGTFGPYTYTDEGATITIDQVSHFISGAVEIPAMIDGKPVTKIGPNAFYTRHSMTSVSLPHTVESIGSGAFFFCSNLRTVTMEAGITEIGEGAFEQCSRLTSVTVPAGVSRIGENAFEGCDKLTEIALPDSVRILGRGAFTRSGLVRFTLPPQVTDVPFNLLGSCDDLVEIELHENVRSIEDYAFSGTSIRSLVIPSEVRTLGFRAFENCRKLESVRNKASLRSIGKEAFANCGMLKRVRNVGSIREIGDCAFQATALNSFDFSDVRTIGKKAFYACPELLVVEISSSVKSIRSEAFANNALRESVIFEGDAPETGKKIFGNVGSDFRIFISDKSAGFTAPRWQGYLLSRPAGEIAIQGPDGGFISNGGATVKFPGTRIRANSDGKVFTIRNVGNKALTGLKADIDGHDDGDFRLTYLGKPKLAPGKTARVRVVFKPLTKGRRTAELEIFSSDRDEARFTVQLSGTGLTLIGGK